MARRTILFVCSGNICRSPMAEYLLRSWLGPSSEWEIRSAGVMAVEGLPASREAVEVLREKGIDLSHHASEALDWKRASQADIIICMTRAHVAMVRHMFPNLAPSKVVLFSSFSAEDSEDDIEDPIGQSVDVYRATRDRMDRIIPDMILRLRELFGQDGRRTS